MSAAAEELPLLPPPPERFDIHTMNSSVIGTIELSDKSIESILPASIEPLPARIREAYSKNAAGADFAIVTEEVIDADVAKIRRELCQELTEIMRAVDALGRRA